MMRLSRFCFVVLISICSILGGGVLTIVEAKTREYTLPYQGSDGVEIVETILKTPILNNPIKPQSPPPSPNVPSHHIHPVYEAREFLAEHNKIRKQLGESPLVWDRKLAHYARRFAAKRAVNCDMLHSDGPYGENVYWGADYSKHTAADAVRAWAGENNYYNPTTNTCNPTKLCGHYKQMVWKTSTKLGCARTKCNNGGVYIICSYDPPGNYFGESPFDTPESSQTPSTPTSKTTPPTPIQTPTTPAAQTKPTSPSTPS